MSLTAIDGVLLIDKPTGCTSHDVVDRVRRKLKMRRIGHAGTLDPLATGLLIILVGKATKASQYLMGLDKEYEATMLLGAETNSHDSDGEVVKECPLPELTEESLKTAMQAFEGDQFQIPPMFSAKKINGVPLYKHARKGRTIEREARFIHVSKFGLLKLTLPKVEFRLGCSKGTYVRTIAHDLGQKLGCGAHLTELRRTHIGKFDIKQAITLEDLEAMDHAQIQKSLIAVYNAVPSMVL